MSIGMFHMAGLIAKVDILTEVVAVVFSITLSTHDCNCFEFNK